MSYNFKNIELFICLLLFLFYSNSQNITYHSVRVNSEDSTLSSVFTSDFHRQNAGKILFSNKPIEPGNENQSELKNKFSSKDNIWGIIYLNDSFKNLTESNKFEVIQNIIVDGRETAHYSFRMLPQKIGQSYLKTEIVVPPDMAMTKGVKTYLKGLSGLSEGEHDITITMKIHNDTVAIGNFTLDCNQGAEYIKELNNDYETKAMSGITIPQPAMRDIILEADLLDLVTDMPGTALKVVITDSGWTLIKNQSDETVFRTINTAVIFRKTDGKCAMVFISFRQDKENEGYGKTQKYAVGNSYDIVCEKVK
ncbi:MAG: hypothetical protein EPN82_13405 [Bacteroidetes bacterium]|nr:MAG: hypothetical protein EPN82_13405 [Bacteroidota bacterium]